MVEHSITFVTKYRYTCIMLELKLVGNWNKLCFCVLSKEYSDEALPVMSKSMNFREGFIFQDTRQRMRQIQGMTNISHVRNQRRKMEN